MLSTATGAPRRFAAGTLWALCVLCFSASVFGQSQPVPQPFPRPGSAQPPPPVRPGSQPTAPPPPTSKAPDGIPTEALLGVPVYPGAQFLASYDAGRGQRYYIFGSAAPFVDLVTYYRSVLKQ